MEQALYEVARNFPVKAVRPVLRWVTLPRGRKFDGPSDSLNGRVCDIMLNADPNSDLAGRLRYDVYVGDTADDPTGRMLRAYEKLREVEPHYEAFLKAVKNEEVAGENVEEQLADAVRAGVLDEAQARAVAEYDVLRYDAILTDDFSHEYLVNPLSKEARAKEERAGTLRKAS
jgi:acyl-CoA dehydrogenase